MKALVPQHHAPAAPAAGEGADQTPVEATA
jgi:hypothetical protein